jgi:hypothetical protein
VLYGVEGKVSSPERERERETLEYTPQLLGKDSKVVLYGVEGKVSAMLEVETPGRNLSAHLGCLTLVQCSQFDTNGGTDARVCTGCDRPR